MSKVPTAGVSLKIKVFVIFLTIVTVVAFSVFFFKLVTKISSTAKTSSASKTSSPAEATSSHAQDLWTHELQIVGDKLKKAGLKKQAIEQYSQFLQYTSVAAENRSRVSQTIAELYVELGDCREALVWLYRAQVAAPSTDQKPVLETQINTCLNEINSERP